MSYKYSGENTITYLITLIKQALTGKVDKEQGKGLSTNDYTTAEKNKLAGLSNYILPTATADTLGGVKVGSSLTINEGVLEVASAGVAEQVDWSGVMNKPAGLVVDTTYVHTDNNYSTAEKNKLSGIAVGAEVNVNADWNATSGDAQILNKPVIPTVPTISTSITTDANSDAKTASPKAVKDYVDARVATTYRPAGSVTFANLPTLSANIVGNMYNITDAFITTADFIEGAGNSHPAGTNVGVVSPSAGVYKFDAMAGMVDLTGYVLESDLVEMSNTDIDNYWNSI